MHRHIPSMDKSIPYGPCLEENGVRFRLWAPEAKQVGILRMTANVGATPFLVDTDADTDFDSLITIYLPPDARRHGSGVELEGWGVIPTKSMKRL